jgi:adenylosuccinate lyase
MIGAVLRLGKIMCTSLQVDEGAMMASLEATRGYVLSEGVMLVLAQKIGKQTAHDMVYAAAMAAFEADRPLKEAILENEEIMAHLSVDEIEDLFDYRRQLGLCPELVDRVVELTRGERGKDMDFIPKGL